MRMNCNFNQACVVYLLKDRFVGEAIVKLHFLEASHCVERCNNGFNSVAIVNIDRRNVRQPQKR